jgi:glycosyltransferase involved in cell wall biosynthesis
MLHAENKSGIKQITTTYSIKIKAFNFSKNETSTYLFTWNKLNELKPQVVIHEFAIGILSLPIAFIRCRLRGIKFILYSHGYNRKKGFRPATSVLDKIRLLFLRYSDAVIVYGQYDKQLLGTYIETKKIFVAQNTLDTQGFIKLREQFEQEGKEKVKQRIGFSRRFNLIFIGRLLAAKQPLLVLDALQLLVFDLGLDVALHYVGDGAELVALQERTSLLGLQEHVVFHGAVHDDMQTGELLFSSDMMAIPGYLGLSVNHAFCFDCPVLSFEQQEYGPFHSPEVEYVIDRSTGYLLTEHSAEAIANTLDAYLKNPTLQMQFKQHIRSMVVEVFPVEKMVKGFEDAINYVMNN